MIIRGVAWSHKQHKVAEDMARSGGARNHSSFCYREVLPFTAIVVMECTNVGLNTLYKLATRCGMSRHVFVVYAYAVVALVLLPSPFLSRQSDITSSATVEFLHTAQDRSPRSHRVYFTDHGIHRNQLQFFDACFGDEQLGPGLYFCACRHFQTQILKEYPAELTLVFSYTLCVSILGGIVGFFEEPDSSKWKITLSVALASFLCSGIFGCCLNNAVHAWALHVRGPVYVAMFKPLSIAIAAAMGVIILGDTLYLGSVIGATVIAIGFYTVMWGKSKEEMVGFDETSDLESPSATLKHPLLLSHKAED